ncbi:MAG: cell division protein SepF [Erysipelotrichaceae bacterium]|nr:cell division protein SepF [Erysipelotrichaceae bacterium]
MEEEKKGILSRIIDTIFEPDPEKKKGEGTGDITRDYQEGNGPIEYLLIVVRPKAFMDAGKICDHLKNGRAIIIHTEEMKTPEKQRFLDFMSGVAMAREGTIVKLQQDVFICTPKNVGIIEE